MSWAVVKQRAARQTVMMKTDVKPQETVKARPVSTTCPPPDAHSNSHTKPLSSIPFTNYNIVGNNNNNVQVSALRTLLLLPQHLAHDVHTSLCEDVQYHCYIFSCALP